MGLDLVGNMGTCSVSVIPEIVSLSAKPNSTAVYLRPGETTKVPFTLTNLGSKGSFSFQVTKTSALISYVIPFSLALETNSSTAGHVIIKSRGETIEEQNLTVTAVSQTNHVNITLFYIQVSVSSGPVTQATDHTTTVSLPVLKHVDLEADVNDKDLSIELGKSLEVGFNVKNLASAETFTFAVSF